MTIHLHPPTHQPVLWVFLLFLSGSISEGSPIKSPLDSEDAPDRHFLQSPPLSADPSPRILESDLVNLPECQRNCARELAETMSALLKLGGTHVERYQTVCRLYLSSRKCISHCPDPVNLFDTMTSGIAYMCNEQKLAFNATIECVDASSSDVQRECDQTCNTQAVMFKWFMEGMHRMSEHGAAAGMGGAHGGGGGLLNLFSGIGGMRVEEEAESSPSTPISSTASDLVMPYSVGRITRDVPEQQPRALFEKSSPLSFLNAPETGIAATGTKANQVLETVQHSINAFTQPKNSPLFPSAHQPMGKSTGHGHSSFPSSSLHGLGGHSEMGNPVDLSVMRDFTSDACQVSECFLSCVKSKMNARCDGTAGSLLSEVFMRPLARAQENLSSAPMAGSLFGFLLPPQCRFMYDTSRMADYRMDSSLDEDLKRTYKEKVEEQEKLDAESVMPTPLAEHISPFDSDQNIDDLIAQVYGEGSGENPPMVLPTNSNHLVETPMDSNSQLDQPMEFNPPMNPPMNSIQPANPPTDSNPPVVQRMDFNPPMEPSVDDNPPENLPIGSDPPMVQPLNSNTPMVQPIISLVVSKPAVDPNEPVDPPMDFNPPVHFSPPVATNPPLNSNHLVETPIDSNPSMVQPMDFIPRLDQPMEFNPSMDSNPPMNPLVNSNPAVDPPMDFNPPVHFSPPVDPSVVPNPPSPRRWIPISEWSRQFTP